MIPTRYEPVPEAAGAAVLVRVEAAVERAAIMEYDGGLDREHAERYAAQQWGVPVEWLR